MKKILSLFFALILVFTFALPVFAAEDLPFLTDEADLLIAPDEEEVTEALRTESEKADCLIAVYTTADSDAAEKTLREWDQSRDFVSPAVVLTVSADEQLFSVLTFGECEYEIDDAFSNVFVSDLNRADYRAAFLNFAKGVRRVMTGESAVVESPEKGDLLWDEAELLTEEEQAAVREELRSRSNGAACEIAILTRDYINEDEIGDEAVSWYREQGYADDAVLLVISKSDRGWYVYVHGACGKAIEDTDGFFERFKPLLSEGEWKEAFLSYAENAETIVNEYRLNGTTLRVPYKKTWILIGIGAGLLVAFLVTGSMKRKLQSVAYQRAAANYVVPGSLNLTNSSDIYLYSTVTRTARPKDNDSRSGGGDSGGHGSGGHF